MASRRKQSAPIKRKAEIDLISNQAEEEILSRPETPNDLILDLSTKKQKVESSSATVQLSPLDALANLTAKADPPRLPQFVPTVANTLDCLTKLSSLVQMVGTTANTTVTPADWSPRSSRRSYESLPAEWWTYVKREQTAEVRRASEAKQIFTCLQCQTAFHSMDELVKHMEISKHFANVPKHYSWSVQYAKQKIRQMKIKMKYSDRILYFCEFCKRPFTESVYTHFSELHNMHDSLENMNFVHVITMSDQSPMDFPSATSASAQPNSQTAANTPTTSVSNSTESARVSGSRDGGIGLIRDKIIERKTQESQLRSSSNSPPSVSLKANGKRLDILPGVKNNKKQSDPVVT